MTLVVPVSTAAIVMLLVFLFDDLQSSTLGFVPAAVSTGAGAEAPRRRDEHGRSGSIRSDKTGQKTVLEDGALIPP